MITADNVTDDQIRSITERPLFRAAKEADRPPWRVQLYAVQLALEGSYFHRAICADILNERAGHRGSR